VSTQPPSGTDPTPDELRRRFAVLQRVAVLFTLPDTLLRALARQLHPGFAAKGSVVINQGDQGDSLFIVEEGRCEVTVKQAEGHEITISYLGDGDFFGEMALISEDPRSASVRALTDCKLLVLDRQTLYATIPADSDALIDLQKLVEQRKATLANIIARATLVAPEQAATTVAVYSPKGGSGRTTMAINLAASLAQQFPGEVLLVDNLDSFSFNLVESFERLGCKVRTVRNSIDAGDAFARAAAAQALIVISPGPGRPENAGCCIELIRLAPDRDFSVLRRTDESSPLAAAITPHVNGLLDRDAVLLNVAEQRWRAMGHVVEADLAARDAADL